MGIGFDVGRRCDNGIDTNARDSATGAANLVEQGNMIAKTVPERGRSALAAPCMQGMRGLGWQNLLLQGLGLVDVSVRGPFQEEFQLS